MTIKQDNVTGKIKSSSLTSERARQLALTRWRNERSKRLEELLREAGFEPETAPAHIRLLAERAVSKNAGSVSALRFFLALTGSSGDDDLKEKFELKPNEPCPLCGRTPLSNETLDKLLQILRCARENSVETPP